MINNLVRPLLLVPAFMLTLIWGSDSHSKAANTNLQEAIDQVNDMNKQLPKMADKWTRFDSVYADKKSITYKCTLVEMTKKQFNYKDVKRQKGLELADKICSSGNPRILLDTGVKFVYIYYDKTGAELIRFDIDRSKCSK